MSKSDASEGLDTEADALDRILPILNERDPFRLVIRGYALVEEALDAAIDAAFTAGTPDELSRLRGPGRLALARALEVLDSELSDAIKTLARIRNRLAHGVDELSPQEREELVRTIEPIWPPGIVRVSELDDEKRLRLAVAAIWGATSDLAERAVARRREAEEALGEYRKRYFVPLTEDQIAELFEEGDLARAD